MFFGEDGNSNEEQQVELSGMGDCDLPGRYEFEGNGIIEVPQGT